MKRQFRRIRLLLMTAPLAVAIPVPEDSSYVQFSGAAGGGSYLQVIEDCSGSNIATTGVGNYADAGLGFEFRDHNGVLAGVRGGAFRHDGGAWQYGVEDITPGERGWWLNPYFGGDTRMAGFKVGLMHAEGRIDPNEPDTDDNFPALSLRIGNRQTWYWTASLGESFPIYSGGGYGVHTGLGVRPLPGVGLWFGAGAGLPYDGDTLGLLFQSEARIFPQWYLDVTGRIDTQEGLDQAGVALGITWRRFR